ncbi:hypothetical protein [Flaviaesturariibacter amylovorans]|uniref:Uncharacterized protein n=1 Tax=Flaviaesturariibacter amylovorans TaxID=1084520 RepID=A0ABP8G486_9BACT
MRTLLPLLLAGAIAFASCSSSKNVFTASDFSQQASTHKKVAVLPVRVVQTGHVGKNETAESIRAANEAWSAQFQETLLSYIVSQAGKRRKGPLVSFQGAAQTNALLKSAGLDIETAYGKSPEELAKLLGVDAVMMTTLDKKKNVSDGVATAVGVGRDLLNVFGKGGRNTGTSLDGFNATDINMNSTLYNGPDGRMLWKTFREGGDDLPNNVNDLVQYYSNWIAKKLPYRS